MGRGGNTINSNTVVTSRALDRGGNKINSDSLATAKAASLTWAGVGT